MSFPRYPEYRDTGLTSVPLVPRTWSVLPLKRLVRLQAGDSISSDRIEEAGAYPVFGGNGIRGFTGDFTHDGTFVLVGRQGALCGNVNYATGRFWASEHALVGTPRPGTNIQWLGEALRAVNLNQYSISAAQPGLSVGVIGAIPIAVPPFEEQCAIATFLEREVAKIDALVAEQERLIDVLQEKRQAVISHAVTNGLDPDVAMKSSGLPWLGDVPAHWVRTPLWTLFRLAKRQGHADQPVLSVYRDYGVILKASRDDNINKTPDDLSSYQLVEPGDLVINKMKAWQGSLGISPTVGITSPDYAVFVPTHHEDPHFLHSLLRSLTMVSVYLGISTGIRLDQWRIEPHAFLRLEVFLPPPSEQRQITSWLAQEEQNAEVLSRAADEAIALLHERRAALISASVTGQIDVRAQVIATQAARKPYSSGFARQILAAEILTRFHSHPTMGRVELQKLIHLCEYVGQIEEVHGDYRRQAAGPFDQGLMFGVVKALSGQQWFSERRESSRSHYVPLAKAGGHSKYLARWQDRMPAIEKVLQLLGTQTSERCEIVSTLYAAWNDLLIEGRTPSDSEIIREATELWHASKASIAPERWPKALDWMRTHDLIPTGFGAHTRRATTAAKDDA